MKSALLLLLCLLACFSPAIQAADVESAQDAVRLELDALQACAPAGDGGTCPAARTRALERGAYCANLRILRAHRAAEPDAGIECQP